MNDPKQILLGDNFVESGDFDSDFNDLLRLFEEYILAPLEKQTAINIGNVLDGFVYVENMGNYLHIISIFHRRGLFDGRTIRHFAAIFSFNKFVGRKFMEFIRGETGTKHEQEYANSWLDFDNPSEYVLFLNNEYALGKSFRKG